MTKFKIFTDKRGSLIALSLKKNIPFKSKRVFILYGKKNYYRGEHAHYKCSQYIVPVNGSAYVEYENYYKKTKKLLSFKKGNSLLLKPKTWNKIKFNNNNSMLMVFCDREYEYKDYIRDYDNFLKIIKKK